MSLQNPFSEHGPSYPTMFIKLKGIPRSSCQDTFEVAVCSVTIMADTAIINNSNNVFLKLGRIKNHNFIMVNLFR